VSIGTVNRRVVALPSPQAQDHADWPCDSSRDQRSAKWGLKVILRSKQCCDQSQQGSPLFDHFVGSGEHRRQHVEARRLGSRKVDDESETGRRPDRMDSGAADELN